MDKPLPSPSRRRALQKCAAYAAGGTTAWLTGQASAWAAEPAAAAGWTFETLRVFQWTDGTGANGELAFGPDGLLYGTQAMGGTQGLGTVYRCSPSDGSFEVIHNFEYSGVDGFEPEGGLVLGSDGRLYGTTLGGGANFIGTIYSVGVDGSVRVDASFDGAGAGHSPQAALVEGRPGHYFGVTTETVYRFDTAKGKLKLIHAFNNDSDGFAAQSALVAGPDRWLYGVNALGGRKRHGTLFRVTMDGSKFEVLKSVNGGSDGDQPDSPMLHASDGCLYGCMSNGGDHGKGVVYRLDRQGGFTVLHHFAGGLHDGAYPFAGLVEGPDGALYGNTVEGGQPVQSWGAVFRITRRGKFQMLHRFAKEGTDGATPIGRMVFGPDGCLYGTCQHGSDNGQGALFRLRPAGA